MVFASLFSWLPSWPKARTEPKIRKSFPPEYPDLIQPTDEEFTTNPADMICKNSSFLQCENERMPKPRAASQFYLEAEAAITPASPFSKGDSRNEPIRQNGPLNSVMSQETQSTAFVNQLQLLEQHIAELEWRGSFMCQDLKKTQFEMLELRDEKRHDKANPYRLEKDNGIRSSPRPVLTAVTGFPPPTPQQFQERIWPTEKRFENVEIFTPTPVPEDGIPPSVKKANPYRLEKDNGIRSSPRPVLTAVTGFPPPTPQQFQERIWPTEKRFENVEIFTQTPVPEDGIPPSVKKANPYRLENDNGIRSSPRPVLTAVTGFPPPTPQQFQERIWPTEKRFENVEIFTQTPVPEDGIPPSASPYGSDRISTTDAATVPGTNSAYRKDLKTWKSLPKLPASPYGSDRISMSVEIFTPIPVPEDGIPPSVKKANPYRLEKDNGIRSSPRPVPTAVTGFPPPTPQQFQEHKWPTQERFENVEIFTPTSVPEDGISPSVKKANPYRLEKDNGIRSSPWSVLTTVTGFPPPTPQQFQERIWPTEKRFQNVKIFTPTIVPEN
ncbi:hypothetical protein OUZ56_005095 [Daphnia magna]|uniref:Uncharacterized protein n=1 Tax=Daphnia magna TaxID=35525 RepID=A0ABQ9YRW6_9CRUS|nr:hypothetical protein OUZ56_005095 [Daphnia magna]